MVVGNTTCPGDSHRLRQLGLFQNRRAPTEGPLVSRSDHPKRLLYLTFLLTILQLYSFAVRDVWAPGLSLRRCGASVPFGCARVWSSGTSL